MKNNSRNNFFWAKYIEVNFKKILIKFSKFNNVENVLIIRNCFIGLFG